METLGALLNGFAVALTPANLGFAALGVTLGTAIGVLPGLGPALTRDDGGPSIGRVAATLIGRIADLRGELTETEGKIVAYRQENRLVNTEARGNPVTLQLTQLNTQLALAQAQRAESEARLKFSSSTCFPSMVRSTPGISVTPRQ